jgi:hypothetical protein
MTNQSYTPPVDRLLTYTNDVNLMRSPWPDYVGELGLTREHTMELVRLMRDRALWELGEDRPEIWAAVHSWRALAQLGADEAIEPMLALIDEDPDNDWLMTEFATVAARIGTATVPALVRVIDDEDASEDALNLSVEALTKVALVHEEMRDQAVAILKDQLRQHRHNDEGYNGFLIAYLIDLGAKEALPLIEEAYDAGHVDEMICGDVNDVLVAFGEEPRPISEQDRALWNLAKARVMAEMFGAPPPDLLDLIGEAPSAPRTPSPQAKAKAKDKRKAAKEARKKNRK